MAKAKKHISPKEKRMMEDEGMSVDRKGRTTDRNMTSGRSLTSRQPITSKTKSGKRETSRR